MKLKLLQMTALTFLLVSSAFSAEVDLAQSSVTWEGTKVTGKHYGKIPLTKGEVELKDEKLVKGEFEVEINKFTVDDLEGEWEQKFLGHLKGEDFFETKKFPKATLKITSVKGNKAEADLTIKGKTNKIKFDINQIGKHFVGVLQFDRTKFGMVYGSGDFFKGLGDKVVHNEVTLAFHFVVK